VEHGIKKSLNFGELISVEDRGKQRAKAIGGVAKLPQNIRRVKGFGFPDSNFLATPNYVWLSH